MPDRLMLANRKGMVIEIMADDLCETIAQLRAECAAMRAMLTRARQIVGNREFGPSDAVARKWLNDVEESLSPDAGKAVSNVVEAARKLYAREFKDGVVPAVHDEWAILGEALAALGPG